MSTGTPRTNRLASGAGLMPRRGRPGFAALTRRLLGSEPCALWAGKKVRGVDHPIRSPPPSGYRSDPSPLLRGPVSARAHMLGRPLDGAGAQGQASAARRRATITSERLARPSRPRPPTSCWRSIAPVGTASHSEGAGAAPTSALTTASRVQRRHRRRHPKTGAAFSRAGRGHSSRAPRS